LADLLRGRYSDVDVELIAGGGGAFEVRREGELIFSKNRLGRFPEDEEIFELLDG
jgi:selT/selW/selH-like putative selenoprotein